MEWGGGLCLREHCLSLDGGAAVKPCSILCLAGELSITTSTAQLCPSLGHLSPLSPAMSGFLCTFSSQTCDTRLGLRVQVIQSLKMTKWACGLLQDLHMSVLLYLLIFTWNYFSEDCFRWLVLGSEFKHQSQTLRLLMKFYTMHKWITHIRMLPSEY